MSRRGVLHFSVMGELRAKPFNDRVMARCTRRTVIAVCRTCAALGMLLAWVMSSSAGGPETIVKFSANESPPYWSKSLPYGGLCGELLHAMSREVNLHTVIEFKPIKRLIDDDTNNVTGNPMFFLANHDYGSTIPIALCYSALFYYRPNRPQGIAFTRLADLRGHRIGILKGTLVDRSYFDTAGIAFEESYTEQSLFKKLKLGRSDMCICIDLVGHSTIRELFPDEVGNFSGMNIPRSVTPIAIMLSKKHPHAKELAKKYKRGLGIITENGTYQHILEKYYGKNRTPEDWFSKLREFADMYDIKGEYR